jgi:formylglycine-generating enzyme
MKKLLILFSTAIILVVNSCTHNELDNLVLVKGGTFKNKNSLLYGQSIIITDFYIGKYEVTQKEWMEVMGSNPSTFKGDNLPVETVSWYDCVEYCNKRSVLSGLEPYYNIDKDNKDPDNIRENDDIKWTVTFNRWANGYRLPAEAEWEYASGGGIKSRSYIFSGSNDINEVAWYWKNSGDTIMTGNWSWVNMESNNCRTHPVGSKKPNELGIYDMSGNVREWCEQWYEDLDVEIGLYRVQRGGGWIGDEYRCQSSIRDYYEAYEKSMDQGFRVARSIIQ